MSTMTLVNQSPQFMIREIRTHESYRDSRWEVAAISQRAPFKFSANEDAAVVIPVDDEAVVLAIADGCGGMRGGEKASKLAVRCLARSVKHAANRGSSIRGAILDGIEQANEAVQALKIGAACTIAVAECVRGRMRTYHVGDSMVIVASNRGSIRYQSLCHSPVGYAVESGLLDENQAMRHENRHLVSNLVGNARMRIEVGPWVKLLRHDRVLIASDGLFDNLRLDEITDRLSHRTLEESLTRLSKLAIKRMRCQSESLPGKPDDLTILAMRPISR